MEQQEDLDVRIQCLSSLWPEEWSGILICMRVRKARRQLAPHQKTCVLRWWIVQCQCESYLSTFPTPGENFSLAISPYNRGNGPLSSDIHLFFPKSAQSALHKSSTSPKPLHSFWCNSNIADCSSHLANGLRHHRWNHWTEDRTPYAESILYTQFFFPTSLKTNSANNAI